MARLRIILNPAAGRGRGARARQAVERELKSAGIPFDLTETTGPGDATRQAHAAAGEGYDAVVAVGGDGTANEVARGLLAYRGNGSAAGDAPLSPAGTLGIVPVGTGNDYAWRLGLKEYDVAGACRAIGRGASRVVDIGRVVDERGDEALFNNHLGGGFEAAANIEARKLKHLPGLLLYLAAVLKVIPQYSRGRPVTIHRNGASETRRVLLASVANGGRAGGGFKVAPDAQLDDEELDLVLADAPNAGVILWLLPHFIRGTHASQKKYVAMDRLSHVLIEAPDGIPVHIDGEIWRADARRLEISVLPKRLRVIGA